MKFSLYSLSTFSNHFLPSLSLYFSFHFLTFTFPLRFITIIFLPIFSLHFILHFLATLFLYFLLISLSIFSHQFLSFFLLHFFSTPFHSTFALNFLNLLSLSTFSLLFLFTHSLSIFSVHFCFGFFAQFSLHLFLSTFLLFHYTFYFYDLPLFLKLIVLHIGI